MGCLFALIEKILILLQLRKDYGIGWDDIKVTKL